MNEKTFTTGQVLGITLLHRMSVYRYVRDFQPFFSPTAQQHKKGRRWTLGDLETLQAIKYLHHIHNSKTEIQEILSAGWRPAIKPIYDLETIALYFDEIFAYSQEAKKVSKEIKEQLAILQSNNRRAATLEQSVSNMSKRLWDINQELLRIKFYLRSPTKPQRREFFRTWQQFKEELKKVWDDEAENTKE